MKVRRRGLSSLQGAGPVIFRAQGGGGGMASEVGSKDNGVVEGGKITKRHAATGMHNPRVFLFKFLSR